MTGRDDEPEGWDPTRPPGGGAARDRRPDAGAAGETGAGGDAGAEGDAAAGAGVSGGAGEPASEGSTAAGGEDPPAGGEDPAAGGEGPAAGGEESAAGGEDPAVGPEGAVPQSEEEPRDAGRPPVLLPHLERLAALASRTSSLEEGAARYARWAESTLRAGGKLLLCGNGGSAATAEHVAAEYVVRFERGRRPLPAVALTGSGSVTTAAANDFSYEETFERPLRALAAPGDLVVLHSTTGESGNLVRAARAAAEMGVRTVALLAAGGGRLAGHVDLALVVPTDEPARAQELHLAIEHAVADRVDGAFAGEG